MSHERPLEDQLAIVTGASRGIGAAIAAALAKAGAMVVGTATSASGADSISQRFAELGLAGEGRVLELGDPAAPAALIDSLPDGRTPAILVNNAGITRDQLLLRMKDEDWTQVLDVNLGGVFRLSKAVLRPMMKARFGRIINIGSVVGITGNPGQSNYAAAKAGIIGFSKSLAREVGSRGITVNTVAPGFIETDMTADLPAANREALLGQTALGRLGQADEIAAAVLFLAGPGAAYITGETLHVNGGMYMP